MQKANFQAVADHMKQTPTTQAGQPESTTKLAKSSEEALNRIFSKIQAIFPAWRTSIKSAQELEAVKREWLRGLKESGIQDAEMIQRGMKRARASGKDFLPNVGQFVNWCKHDLSDYGLPDAREAYRIASREAGKYSSFRDWRHPAIYETACRVGFMEIRGWPESRAFKYWEPAYDGVCNEVMAGKQFQAPKSARIEKKPSVRTSRAEGIRRAKELMNLIDS